MAKTTVLQVKNMVCPRCIKVVETIIIKLGYHPIKVVLGEVYVKEILTKKDNQKINIALKEWGFELLYDKEEQLVSRLKSSIIDLIHYTEINLNLTNSVYLSQQLNLTYAYLSKVFSQYEKITIEKYIIQQKIERVKELVSYNELSLKEIAYRLNYSSVQHLSKQFKSVMGISITEFRKLEDKNRKTLDDL